MTSNDDQDRRNQPRVKTDRPASEEEIVELVHETLDQLTLLADKLESFVGGRPPTARTRRDDFGDPAQ